MKIWKITIRQWVVFMAFESYPDREEVLERLRSKYPDAAGRVADQISNGDYDCVEVEVL